MDTKFFTTPRPLNDTSPIRPSRNYSTLGPSRPPRKKSPLPKQDDKENIDQYIEIDDSFDDEHARDLQSGEVISKMKGRPLPAPPRPPRKGRDSSREAFRDVTYDDNIMREFEDIDKDEEALDIPTTSEKEAVEEIEVSTQTDPLPDDFVCEEVKQEPTDKIVAPRRRRRSTLMSTPDPTPRLPDSRPKTPLDGSASPHVMVIERRVQTPTVDFDTDSTLTHASLIVKPVPEYPPDSYVSQRFSADLPDIMPEILSSATYPAEEEIESFSMLDAERIKSIPTSETLDQPTSEDDFIKQIEEKLSTHAAPEEPRDYDEEFRKNMLESTEDDLVCDILPPVEEQPPAIPEKPSRMKLKQEQSEKVEFQPESPPVPPLPHHIQPQPQIIERIIERPVPFSVAPGPDTEVEVLRASRLQVADLDVERLNVTELQAQKISVSEIDGVNLQISELSSKTGSIIINGLEIPSGLIQEILDKLQPYTQPQPQPAAPPTEPPTEPKEPLTVEQKITKLASEPVDIQDAPLSFPEPEQKPEPSDPEASSEDKKKREFFFDEPVESDSQPLDDEANAKEDEMIRNAIEDLLSGKITDLQQRIATLQEQMTLDTMYDSEDEVVPDEPLSEFDEALIEEIPEDDTDSKVRGDTLLTREEEIGDEEVEDIVEEQGAFEVSIPTRREVEEEDTRIDEDLGVKVEKTILKESQAEIQADISKDIEVEVEETIPKEPDIKLEVEIGEELDVEIEEAIEKEPEIGEDVIVKVEETILKETEEKVQAENIEDLEEIIPKETEVKIQAEIAEDLEEIIPIETEVKVQAEITEEIIPIDTEVKVQAEIAEEIIPKETEIAEEITPKEIEVEVQAETGEQLVESFPKVPEIPTTQEEIETELLKQLPLEETKTDTKTLPTTTITEAEIEAVSAEKEEQPKLVEEETVRKVPEEVVEVVKKETIETVETSIVPEAFSKLEVEESDKGLDSEKPKTCELIKEPIIEEEISVVNEPVSSVVSEKISKLTEMKPEVKEHPKQEKRISDEHKKHIEASKIQRTLSHPVAPSEVPPPKVMGDLAQSHVLQGLPASYYPQLVDPPPPTYYPLRSQQDLSEEDIPVHHRRRRHHRRMSRSSSEEDEPRAVSRRRATRSPEPTVPQLTSQLVRASAGSLNRVIRQCLTYINTQILGTSDGKQDLQIALIIILVVIAGLILLGFGGGKTIHLHHWEYFNPPTDI